MYDRLLDLATRPMPFACTTTRELWTDPHIATQMLAFHLDGSHDLASRRTGSIDAFVDWVDRRLGLAGRRVLDLGCGPGLYAERMAARGAVVTGVDFSAHSLAHARISASGAGLEIDYRHADYLADPLPEALDMVTLIYCDYGALPPDKRARLLARIRRALRVDGRLILDVFPPDHALAYTEGLSVERRMLDGFFSAADYFGLRARHRYAEHLLTLDRYLILAEDRSFEIWNWDQCFSPESLAAEFSAAGFAMEGALEFATGGPWQPGASPITAVARPV